MRNIKMKSERIYLDYAATTPVDPAVLRAMKPYFSEKFGNAGSLHSFGQEAIAAVDQSREIITKAIGAEFREVIFTSSATEANNLALRGIVEGCRVQGAGYSHKGLNPKPHPLSPRVIVSCIEHESVLETARDLERSGVEVVYLPVDRNGIVDLKKLKAALNENTILVSVMYVNNEIGTVQPIVDIAEIIQNFRRAKSSQAIPHTLNPIPYFHTDASQAFQFFDCDVKKLGVDLMTLSSHKIYGPKGAAALYIRNHGVSRGHGSTEKQDKRILPTTYYLLPTSVGGGQEFGLRSGTENVSAIVGFGRAVQLLSNSRELESKKTAVVCDEFWRDIKKIYPRAQINGVFSNVPRTTYEVPLRAPHILNIHFPGHDAQDILTRLDLAGIAASSGSACRSRAMESSYVIEALGYSKTRAKSSIRFSFGCPTTKGEINVALKVLKQILK